MAGLADAVTELLASPGGELTAAGLADRHPELAAHAELLDRCVAALPGVLEGTVRGAEVLFPRGSTELVERVYHGLAAADFYHRLLADEVTAAARRLAAGPDPRDRRGHRGQQPVCPGGVRQRRGGGRVLVHRRVPGLSAARPGRVRGPLSVSPLRPPRHRAKPGRAGFRPVRLRRGTGDQRAARDPADRPDAGLGQAAAPGRRYSAGQRDHWSLWLCHPHLRSHPGLVAVRRSRPPACRTPRC